MKVRITVTDDSGKEYEGAIELDLKKLLSPKGKNEDIIQPTKKNSYKGLVGGISFLIDNNFFNKPHLVSEIQSELKREGYHYGNKSVDKILRDFQAKKILTRIDENGKWKYVIRK